MIPEHCKIIPIPSDIVNSNLDKIHPDAKIDVFHIPKMSIVTIDSGACGFLGSNGKCRIYNDRPDICRRDEG